jgi:GDP-L-fucose synthase
MVELAEARVLVAGAGGVVGAALMRRLNGAVRFLRGWRTKDGDLREESVAQAALAEHDYDVVFLLAATQGGIADNIARRRAFLEDNARITLNVVRAAADRGVPRLIFAGSAILYAPDAAQPYQEAQVGQAEFDQTHQGYALAKLMGLRLCSHYTAERKLAYTTAVLGSVFGPGCSFDPARANVAPSLIKRAIDARRANAPTLSVWGTGNATRDLLAADDPAEARWR